MHATKGDYKTSTGIQGDTYMAREMASHTYIETHQPHTKKDYSYRHKAVVDKRTVYLPVVAAPQVMKRTKALTDTSSTNNSGRRVTRAASCVHKLIPTPRALKTYEDTPHPRTYRLEYTTGEDKVWAEEWNVMGGDGSEEEQEWD